MTIQYSLSEHDYLNFQLYAVSKSARSVKKRRASRLFVVLCLLIVCGTAYISGHADHLYVLAPLTLAVFLLWPTYQRWYYKKHYLSHIHEHYGNKVNEPSTLKLDAHYITTSGKAGESKMYLREVKELNETGDYLFVKLSTGESLILPKSEVDAGLFKKELLTLLPAESLVITEEPDWKW